MKGLRSSLSIRRWKGRSSRAPPPPQDASTISAAAAAAASRPRSGPRLRRVSEVARQPRHPRLPPRPIRPHPWPGRAPLPATLPQRQRRCMAPGGAPARGPGEGCRRRDPGPARGGGIPGARPGPGSARPGAPVAGGSTSVGEGEGEGGGEGGGGMWAAPRWARGRPRRSAGRVLRRRPRGPSTGRVLAEYWQSNGRVPWLGYCQGAATCARLAKFRARVQRDDVRPMPSLSPMRKIQQLSNSDTTHLCFCQPLLPCFKIALDAVMLALQRHVRNWVHDLRHSLSVVDYNMHLDLAAMHNIDISELRICLSAHLARAWTDLAPNPRACPTAGARLCTYLRWFARPTNSKADLLRLPLPRKAMVGFLRFRTGCHALPNVIGTRTGVPRSQRLCPLCQSPYSDERAYIARVHCVESFETEVSTAILSTR